MSSADYGYHHYNKKKPKTYVIAQYMSRLSSLDMQLEKLQQEAAEIRNELNEYLKK